MTLFQKHAYFQLAGLGGNFEEHGFARSSFIEKEVEVGEEEVGEEEVGVGEYDYSLAFTPYNRDLLEVGRRKIF